MLAGTESFRLLDVLINVCPLSEISRSGLLANKNSLKLKEPSIQLKICTQLYLMYITVSGHFNKIMFMDCILSVFSGSISYFLNVALATR